MDGSFRGKADALKAIDEAVLLFNAKRPHLSLRFKTPDRVDLRFAEFLRGFGPLQYRSFSVQYIPTRYIRTMKK